MEHDREHHTVKILNETFSLKEVNVVLVDFVGSQAGPAIVGWRWIEPGPAAPPVVPGAAGRPYRRRDPPLGRTVRLPTLRSRRCGSSHERDDDAGLRSDEAVVTITAQRLWCFRRT